MRILALIPARGGSKRLPRKNILPLGGKPLIVWSIDVAKDIPEICDILVSTDDFEIAEISKKSGALVPWLRPAELATDTATSVDVALHALDWYENEKSKVDGILLLQPTSPFRSKSYVLQGIKLFIESHFCSVVSVSPVHTHPMWTFKIENNFLVPFLNKEGIHIRSQDLPPLYAIDGSFYLSNQHNLYEKRSFFGTKTIPLIANNSYETVDIDTEWDFMVSEFLIERFKKQINPI